jgi:hypothetical protein
MKERPVLMSGPMVRSLLKGAKRETRRIVKLQPSHHWEHFPEYKLSTTVQDGYDDGRARVLFEHTVPNLKLYEAEPHVACPHGAVGQTLWVRETWRPDASHDPDDTLYRADVSEEWERVCGNLVKWRPSIFMPRQRSRIDLSVTSLAVERVQSITDDGTVREGMTGWTKDGALYKYAPPDPEGTGPMWPWVDCPRTPRAAFERLWGEINGRESWEANVYVWVVGFDVVKGDRT